MEKIVSAGGVVSVNFAITATAALDRPSPDLVTIFFYHHPWPTQSTQSALTGSAAQQNYDEPLSTTLPIDVAACPPKSDTTPHKTKQKHKYKLAMLQEP